MSWNEIEQNFIVNTVKYMSSGLQIGFTCPRCCMQQVAQITPTEIEKFFRSDTADIAIHCSNKVVCGEKQMYFSFNIGFNGNYKGTSDLPLTNVSLD